MIQVMAREGHPLPIDGSDEPGKAKSEKNSDRVRRHHVPDRAVRLGIADRSDLVIMIMMIMLMEIMFMVITILMIVRS